MNLNIGSFVKTAAHTIAEHPGRTALIAGGAIAAGIFLAGCADSTPPPTPTDGEDGPLLNQLRSSGFSNRQQMNVLGSVHANNWSHSEAGNMLVQTAPIVGTSDAIDAWRMTKVNNRSTSEITGMMQSLDGMTSLAGYQISRVARDVIATGYSGQDAVRFFANAPSWTSNDQDINGFERFLGMRYGGWSYSPDVVYDPYPVYQPDPNYGSDYWQTDPNFWDPYRGGSTSPGDGGYGGGYGGGYDNGGTGGGTSPGDGGYGGGYDNGGTGGGTSGGDGGYGGGYGGGTGSTGGTSGGDGGYGGGYGGGTGSGGYGGDTGSGGYGGGTGSSGGDGGYGGGYNGGSGSSGSGGYSGGGTSGGDGNSSGYGNPGFLTGNRAR